jgi:hypothetical protein
LVILQRFYNDLLARFAAFVHFSLEKEQSITEEQQADEKKSCCKGINEMQQKIARSLWYFICVLHSLKIYAVKKREGMEVRSFIIK